MEGADLDRSSHSIFWDRHATSMSIGTPRRLGSAVSLYQRGEARLEEFLCRISPLCYSASAFAFTVRNGLISPNNPDPPHLI